jgi:hypothetical protein
MYDPIAVHQSPLLFFNMTSNYRDEFRFVYIPSRDMGVSMF